MRRLLLVIFIFILLGILLTVVFHHHQGYLLISFNGWQIETSLLFACAALVIGIWVLAVLWRIVTGLIFAPRNIRGFFGRRRQRKAQRSLLSALAHMAEARWKRAEAEFRELAESKQAPGLNYLFSARAAQYQSHLSDRDGYLEKAAGQKSTSEVAVLFTQAELQTAAGQHSEAQDTLARLQRLEPHHPWVLSLAAENAMARGDYGRIHDQLKDLKKHAALSSTRLHEMSIAAYQYQLSQQSDIGGLSSAWRKVPENMRNSPEMLRHYARCLRDKGGDDEAANAIRGALKHHWDPELAVIFSELKCSDQTEQLASVEDWIKHHDRDPRLMLAAGRLCQRNKLWGRARSYYEASQSLQASPDTSLELGRLFEQIDQADEARSAYRHGLELRTAR